ncbi:cupin domain-containing protein [Roseibium sp. M-1]
MKQKRLPEEAEAKSPAGADISFLMDGPTGNMIHALVPAGQINRATRHGTVHEFWYVLEGRGQIWRSLDGAEAMTTLEPGVAIDIPAGTAFQYRNTGPDPLKFICVSMPPWPGDGEAEFVDGPWMPTLST